MIRTIFQPLFWLLFIVYFRHDSNNRIDVRGGDESQNCVTNDSLHHQITKHLESLSAQMPEIWDQKSLLQSFLRRSTDVNKRDHSNLYRQRAVACFRELEQVDNARIDWISGFNSDKYNDCDLPHITSELKVQLTKLKEIHYKTSQCITSARQFGYLIGTDQQQQKADFEAPSRSL